MRSPALAVAWEFRRRHRWGLLALTGYLALLAATRLLILAPGQSVGLHDARSFALVVVVPLTATFMYFLAVFSFGLSGDLAARQSIYPARLFTLPISTAALAGWPMLYGTAAMAMLWAATRLLAIWPSGVEVPVLWPALLAAALLAWTQALTWMPYALRGLRVVVTILWLAVIDAVVLVALQEKAKEPVMLALLAPHVPLAYFAARFAVARARCGDVPDWGAALARLGRIADALPGRRTGFASPAGAQAWLEWRVRGRSLPALVGILLPFELALHFVFRDAPSLVLETLIGVLFTPPIVAAFVAATAGRANQPGGDPHRLTPFIATRPLTTASLVAAKMKAMLWSTLAAWLLVLVALPLGSRLSGTQEIVSERARRLVEVFGAPRAAAIVLLGLSMLVASTWKHLAHGLTVGLSGREWLFKASVFLTLAVLAAIAPLARWLADDGEAAGALWNAVPWILGLLVVLKMSAAAWIAVRLRDRRLLGDRALLVGAASWDVLVFGLYGLVAWIVPALLVRSYLIVLVAILEVPLARLSAAPLALAWNRHRP